MIALDTNIFVRWIMQDDASQAAKASALLGSLNGDNPGYLTLVTLAELFWVLDRRYKLARQEIIDTLIDLLFSGTLRIQEEASVVEALDAYSRSTTADFSDCLIARCAISAGCNATYTFDRNASRTAGMTLLA